MQKFSVKGCAENRGLLNRKFKIVKIGRIWVIQRDWMQKMYTELHEYANKHMKWKFRPSANLELKICWKLIHRNEKSLQAVQDYFLLKSFYFGSGT